MSYLHNVTTRTQIIKTMSVNGQGYEKHAVQILPTENVGNFYHHHRHHHIIL